VQTGQLSVINSTLSGNSAIGGSGGGPGGGGSGFGGAIFNLNGGVTITLSTIAGNTVVAGSGGTSGSANGDALYNLAYGNNIQDGSASSATVTLVNSILAGSGAAADLVNNSVNGANTNSATVTATAPNIIQTAPVTLGGAVTYGGTVNVDPLLAPLGNYGGPTKTMAPLSGSPAINAGSIDLIPANVTTDQRGSPRVADGTVDLGAVEGSITLPAGNATSLTANFNGTAIPAGDSVWFSSVLSASGLSSTTATTIWFINQTITIGSQVVPVPNASITYHPGTGTSTTVFTSGGWWQTDVYLGSGLSGNQFLSGLGYYLPSGLAGGTKNVTWSGVLFTDQPGVSLNWKWAAAVYTHLPSLGSQASSVDYNAMGIKPVDDTHSSAYHNSDHAGTPEGQLASGSTIKSQVTGGATGGGGANYTGGYSGTKKELPTQTIDDFFAQLGWTDN
jgi:hypothetical protein